MRALRLPALAVLVGGLYAAGALLTFEYFNSPEAGVAFFPPAGLTLATLLLTPRRQWPLWLAAIAVAEVGVDLAHGQTVFMASGFALANMAEPLVGASLMLAYMRRTPATPRGLLIGYVVCAVIAGPVVGGAIGGTVATIAGTGSLLATSATWWLGDALGVLVVATPLLAWTPRRQGEFSAPLVEVFGIAAVAVAVTIVPGVFWHTSFAYAVLPIMMLAALRGGSFGAGVAGMAVGFSASWAVATGHAYALIPIADPEDALIDTQLFIAVTVLAALTLAVEVTERMRTERVLRRAETDRVRADLAALHATDDERRRIARETHDIVGHALNVMILSGAGARRVLDTDPDQARELLGTLEDVGRSAFRDLDVALGLTDQSSSLVPPKGIADLEELVSRLVQAGMQVEYRVDGAPRPVPKLVDSSAYRIVQESLTNVAKHAGEASTRVCVRFTSGTVAVEISNQGNGFEARNGAAGRGLIGMRERVAVLGGRIDAGPGPDGGYSVRAELPIEATAPWTAPIRVLIVDDDVPTRVGLRVIMNAEPDIEVVGETATAEDAYRQIDQVAPDVVLMDVQLPGGDGITATSRITANADGGAPRVIVLTTFDLDEYAFRSLQAGASGFLLKRARAEDLTDAVRSVASGTALPNPVLSQRLIEQYANPSADRAAVDTLTERECEVLLLIARGRSNGEIAVELSISPDTVKTHVKHVFTKLAVRDRAQAVIAAYESGLIRDGQ